MRALLSVFDKTGLVEFARGLSDAGVELVASGGTAEILQGAGVSHLDVADVTGFPEMLDGRVKTLHPRIHAGILADLDRPEHRAALEEHDITSIDLVVCNLYPFSLDPSIELIDIGGPAMVRAAAKNHRHVGVVTNPSQYPKVLEEIVATRTLSNATRHELARAAFAHTAAYDAQIVRWLLILNDQMLRSKKLRVELAPPAHVAIWPGIATAKHLSDEGLQKRLATTVRPREHEKLSRSHMLRTQSSHRCF